MPKSPKQKMKLLYIARILNEETDQNHPVTVAELISALEKAGISAERKSVYDDLESLRLFGMDIVSVRGRTTGYYVASRAFELPELKLLVDTVQSSKFITEKKTLSLISKIESLASRHEAGLLSRQVYVRNRVKSMNESVYYNVDEISSAINGDRVILFKYFEYTVALRRRLRREGADYEISPFALISDDENYYMLGFDAEAGLMKHFRVDKMLDIRHLNLPRRGKEVFSEIDMSAYSKSVFGMFGGRTENVRLRFSNHLAGAVIDRFGRDAVLVPDGSEKFTVTVSAVISQQFFGWVFGFGTDAEILSPGSVREEMKQKLSETARLLYETAP
ncbi:MAG: WYL domain-containing protein [Clostridiales bacterium]|nr:WYL domain-containing protein [Clostridiales bacterium]